MDVIVTVSKTKASAASKKTGIIKKLIANHNDPTKGMTPKIAKAHIKGDPLLANILTAEQIDQVHSTGQPLRQINRETVIVTVEDDEE